jgi:hypothetical protein
VKDVCTLTFSVSVCYISSLEPDGFDPTPIVLPMEGRPRERRQEADAKTRDFPPGIPTNRERSIFHFDKKELIEENTVLTAEISRLTEAVQWLRQVAEAHAPRTAIAKRKEPIEAAHGPDYVYHPPGLRAVTPVRSRKRPVRLGGAQSCSPPDVSRRM